MNELENFAGIGDLGDLGRLKSSKNAKKTQKKPMGKTQTAKKTMGSKGQIRTAQKTTGKQTQKTQTQKTTGKTTGKQTNKNVPTTGGKTTSTINDIVSRMAKNLNIEPRVAYNWIADKAKQKGIDAMQYALNIATGKEKLPTKTQIQTQTGGKTGGGGGKQITPPTGKDQKTPTNNTNNSPTVVENTPDVPAPTPSSGGLSALMEQKIMGIPLPIVAVGGLAAVYFLSKGGTTTRRKKR